MSESNVTPGERGYRRMRLAAMAGSLYRSGQQAVSDMREQYAQTRTVPGIRGEGFGRTSIPGAFPEVGIKVQGNEHLVLFPSYAKRHVKKDWSRAQEAQQQQGGPIRDEVYWKQEWEKNEDAKAIVDVDVRGWVYSPHVGPMTRRNRMLIGLARQLSGIPAPRPEVPQEGPDGTVQNPNQIQEERREQERIEREAAQIERRGREEERVAFRGGYSEKPQLTRDDRGMQTYRAQPRSGSISAPGSPTLSASHFSLGPNEMSEAELVAANANLMARIAPFMTNPLTALPVTVFFYNESHSQSRTVMTNDAGHFNLRAALEFIPTHARVLANENLSAIQEIQITEPHGVSLISDVDDTIKTSNISGGAMEIFRNTFIRELKDLTVEGIREWYDEMHRMGVNIHYCSNSPWQLYPVLGSYLRISGLPPGSLHLKQYSGMLQGIFEPVAERKKTTLDRLFRDFPQRKFLLVGDSGEADLEVYTDLALANPGRVLAIFIRDVTTPETIDYFETSFGGMRRQASNLTLDDSRSLDSRVLPRRMSSNASAAERQSTGPIMGDLIDLTEEPASHEEGLFISGKPTSAVDLLSARKAPPPRPNKPAALRSTPSNIESSNVPAAGKPSPNSNSPPPPTLPARKPVGSGGTTMLNNPRKSGSVPQPPPLPPPRRQGTAASTKSLPSDSDIGYEPLPPSSVQPPPSRRSSWSSRRSPRMSPRLSPTASPPLGPYGGSNLNKKLELWTRRLERAHEQLDQMGVMLYTWRRGQDVSQEAVGIVREAQKDMEKKGLNRMELGKDKRGKE